MLFKSYKEKNSVFKWGIKVYKKLKHPNKYYYRSFSQGKLHLALGDYALVITKPNAAKGSNDSGRKKCQVAKILDLFETDIHNKKTRHAVVQWYSRINDLPTIHQENLPNENRIYEVIQDNRPLISSEVLLTKLHSKCYVVHLDEATSGNTVWDKNLNGFPMFFCRWRFDGEKINPVLKVDATKKKVTFSETGATPKPKKLQEKQETLKPSCSLCDHLFPSFGSLADHVGIEHPLEDNQLPCFFCKSSFPNTYKLKMHYRSHSKPTDISFPCQICKKQFKLRSQLKFHSAVHEKDEIKDHVYNCPHCTMNGQMSAIRHHINTDHEGKFPYNCITCRKGFLVPSLYLKHRERCKLRLEGQVEGLPESDEESDGLEKELALDDEESNDSMEYEGSQTDEEEDEATKLERATLLLSTEKEPSLDEPSKENSINAHEAAEATTPASILPETEESDMIDASAEPEGQALTIADSVPNEEPSTETLDANVVRPDLLDEALGLHAPEDQSSNLMEGGTQVVQIIDTDEDIGLNPVPGQVLVLEPNSEVVSALLTQGEEGKEEDDQTNMVISVEGLYGQQLILQQTEGDQIISINEEAHELLGKVLEFDEQAAETNPQTEEILPPIDFPNLSSVVEEDMEVEPCLFQQVEATSHQYPEASTTEETLTPMDIDEEF